ncbi:endonuclease/exonuclease/phosphatase family protein [Mesorhizobium sp. CAU 1732]|uniref:endonuclease/exonuclease/phosphatase family protein n=1 Tax=Mesorhizobium sp. CAU 1732 TaxID=3140358 RepID=UPI0032614B40
MLIAAGALTAFLAVATILPFFPFAHGIVRVGDFPRQQFLAAAVIVVILSLVFGAAGPAWHTIQIVLVLVAAVQAWFIVRFTPIWRKQSADYDPAADTGETLRLLASNVKMSNERFEELAAEIERRDPDIFVLMEVDKRWRDALSTVLSAYPTVIDQSQENSYGMILGSKFELSDTVVECLLTDGVPSIITTVTTPEGQQFRLYSIHPEPPVPHRGTEGRDGETALVALRVKDETLPVMVTGDLNDVAWSSTTDRFRRISGLLDPRIGRRIFSTFDARFPLMRWPLDHLFHSAEFRLKDMLRLPACGSDHFPVLFDLVLCRTEDAESKPEEADGEDIERARDLVKQADERTEEAIGTDWEK